MLLLSALACLPVAAAPASTREAQLSGQYLVILGSKEDPDEVIPAVATIAAHPELKATVERVDSGHFKNLMPCYTVTIAGASADRAAALALSKRLTTAGIDNYVKNAGAYVGASSAIEAYCARPTATDGGDVRIAWWESGQAFVPIELAESTQETLLAGAPAPRVVDAGWSAWSQPVAIDRTDTVAKGDHWRLVAVETGVAHSCKVAGFTMLTLGIPHFGALQADKELDRPACGAPEPFAILDCDGTAGGTQAWIASPTSTPVVIPLKEATNAAAKAALDADLKQQDAWTHPPAGVDGPATWTTTLRTGVDNGRTVWVGEGAVEIPGNCGGETYSFVEVWVEDAGKLRMVLPMQRRDNTTLLGLVDVDGKLNLTLVDSVFPASTQLRGATTIATLDYAYCDCPC